jgi:hypothetical protein
MGKPENSRKQHRALIICPSSLHESGETRKEAGKMTAADGQGYGNHHRSWDRQLGGTVVCRSGYSFCGRLTSKAPYRAAVAELSPTHQR